MQDLRVKHRSAAVAAWINGLAPGLGFYYLGQSWRAWWVLLLTVLPWFVILLLPWDRFPWLPVSALLLSLLILMTSMWVAWRVAKRTSPMIMQPSQHLSHYLVFSLASLLTILLWLFLLSVKSGLVPYQVTVNSMAGTINKYDWVLITREPPTVNDLQRGDVVLFQHPETGKAVLQRIVGLPGERVTVHGGGLFVNGHWQSELYLDDLRNQKKLPEGVVETTVPKGQFFVLADNRDASRDSRYWGSLPAAQILSKEVYQFKRHHQYWQELLSGYLGQSLMP